MRLVQVAKILGMTGQELRHELTQVNFGVKPTDREVPDALAKGVIRYVARKKGLTIDVDALGMEPEGEEERDKMTDDRVQMTDERVQMTEKAEASGEQAGEHGAASVKKTTTPAAGADMHVLRKLSLEGVSPAAILAQQGRQEGKKMTKEEREEQIREHNLMVQARKGPGAGGHQAQIKQKEGIVMLPDSITVKELAEKTGIQVPKLIQTMMKNGVLATITQSIDYDTAAIVASELGVQVQREVRGAKAEDLLSRNLKELLKDDTENLQPRPPIVVVMGHVDHGKTALLDAIRQTNVVASEAGGITQHIGAYQIDHVPTGEQPRKITFLDTPGHEAFTAMRARGAQVTDIVILVVSAEEGVKPTTVEAIHHALAAEVPIIVAITKIDKERADPDRVKGELAANELQPEEWGGQTPVVLCSAVTKQGIPELLDHILLVADIKELKANPLRPAVATVIESHLDVSFGPLATVIVNAGTLRVGDVCVCGATSGRIKALVDAAGRRLTDVPPSCPARLSGLSAVAAVGDILQVVASDREARTLLEALERESAGHQKRSFADLVSRLTAGKLKQLKVILKTDAQGSLEAIQEALRRHTEGSADVTVKVIHGAVGAVSDSDVMMAAASDGVILAFHANVSVDVRRTAEREGVQIREYAILYELLDEVDRLLKGLVEPVETETVLGHLEIRGVFLTKKSEQIVGGKVTDGVIKRVPFRLRRGETEVGTGRILTLRHVDKDIKEAKEGSECGMRVESTVPVLEGDTLEAFVRELKKKEA